ncbi:hypothetical protein NB311A_07188 [Nitrobacter sp. Nb-311A]|uniref:STAS/SEC14 domain-containing protein n=2 Tax=unclassified Nitrobacter TaxID=2620411 RepID=UPI0000684C24|nr:STAS/SEC14 domain-containing protein [Nitrobacter sp. Nb-311A]EAQ36914.1 hypothetical protein NB311A_07188 [Nitrobacter sp. Nb-311A]
MIGADLKLITRMRTFGSYAWHSMKSIRVSEVIEILPSPDNVFAIHVSGRLTGEDYDRMLAAIEAKLKAHERIFMFVDMIGFDDMTAEAFRKDISYSFGKLGEWHRFARNALVTDKQWMKLLAKAAALFLPQLQIQTFEPSDRDAAWAWLTGASSSRPTSG